MFLKQMQVGHMAVFAYLLGDPSTGEALVIDPAANIDGIIAQADQNKFKIQYIVNTHGHVDHIAGNLDMKNKTGAKIIIHESDAEMLTSTPAMILKMFGAKQSPTADRTVAGWRYHLGRRNLPESPAYTGTLAGKHVAVIPKDMSLPGIHCLSAVSGEPIFPEAPRRSWPVPSSKNSAPYPTIRRFCRDITMAERRRPPSAGKKHPIPS